MNLESGCACGVIRCKLTAPPLFTKSKLPWLHLPDGARAFRWIYKINEVWSAEGRERPRCNRAGRA